MRQFLPGDQARVGAVLVDDLRATLQVGFTSVRELGGAAGHLQPLTARGVLTGPTVYSALTALSITGGHGDEHDYPLDPLDLLRGPTNTAPGPPALCDGVDERVRMTRAGDPQRRARRQALRDGRRASSASSTSPRTRPPSSRPSCRRRRAVAAHAIGKAGIVCARASAPSSTPCTSTEEAAALALEKGRAVLVPTRHIVGSLAAGAEELPADAGGRARAAAAAEQGQLRARHGYVQQ